MKNLSRGFKKRSLISAGLISLFAIIGALISSFAFGQKSTSDTAKAESLMSVYTETKYDYVASNITSAQINQLASYQSVKESAPFYTALASVDTPKGSLDVTIKTLKSEDQLKMTEYTDARLINSCNPSDNAVYISEKLAKTYSLSLGYKFRIAGSDFSISRIYRDSNDITILYAPNFAKLLNDKFGTEVVYNGLYIVANNKVDVETYCASIGVLSLQNKMEGYQDAKKESDSVISSAKNGFVLFGVLSGSIYLFGTAVYLLISINLIKKEIVDTGRKEAIIRTNLSHGIGLFVEMAALVISLFILKAASPSFVKIGSVFENATIGLAIAIAFVALSYLTNFLLIKLLKRNQNKQE